MRSRFLQVIGFGTILLLAGGALFIFPTLRRSIHAQRTDLLAAAARYPKFTLEQRMSVSRARQFELHPTWKDLSLGQAAERLFRLATRLASSTQPLFANFLGNTTSINSPSGTALALVRQSNCSLTLLSGPYTLSFTSPAFDFANPTPGYEQVLHAGAHLTTTADQFAGGCPDPTLGQTARRAVYVGKTSSGLYVFGAYAYNAAASSTQVYSVIADSSYAYQSSTNLATGGSPIAVLTADLNQDGVGDLVSINNPLALSGSASISIFLGNADGSFKPATDVALAGNNILSAVIDDFNNDGKSDIVVSTETLAGNGSTTAYQISFLAGNGDGTFQAAKSVTVVPPAGASNPYAGLTSGSVRGNSNKDIISPSGVLLLGNGDGTFTQSGTLVFPSSLGTSSFGPNAALADFNKDGKLDVALDNGQTINIFNGNGDGTFTVGSAYASINNVGYLYATDLDGDGNIDIYSGSANGGMFGGDQFELNQTYALMGNGNGTFQGAPATPFVFTGTNLADLNGDGKLDGIGVNGALNGSGVSFTTYLGGGNGSFSSQSTLAVSPLTIQGNSYSFSAIDSYGVGDFNGDGKPDLLYFPQELDAPMGKIGYFLAEGDGSGAFQAPAFIVAPSFVPAGDFDYGEAISNVLIADVNRDGKPDILYSYSDEGYKSQVYYQGIAVQLGNGDGTFQAPQTIQTYSGATSPGGSSSPVVQIGDANQDGIPDIFVMTINNAGGVVTTKLQLYLGKGDGTFGAPSTPAVADQINPPSFGSQLAQIVLADVNGDGHSDLVTLGTTSGNQAELAVSLGNGDGTFAAPEILAFGGGSSEGYGLAVADFDGDGKLDVFVGGFNPPIDTGIFLGNGDGTFQSFTDSTGVVQPVQAVGLLVWGPAFASDFNGDGKLDVLAGDAVLLNEGVALATLPATTTTLTASPATAAVGATINLAATVTGASPTGTVTFIDGTTTLGTATLSAGSAAYSTASLSTGAHSITASYGGDANNASSVSAAVTVTITAAPASFSLSLTPASGSVAASGTTTAALTVTPANGFAQPVSFACSGLPSEATCAFSPASVMPGSAPGMTTMTITTGAVASLRGGKLPFAFAGVLGLALLGRRRRMRSRLLSCIAVSALAVMILGIGSCGGGGSSGGGSMGTTGTPAGTSTVTITATAGSLSKSSTYMLTVQ